jgi:hypothetical protein
MSLSVRIEEIGHRQDQRSNTAGDPFDGRIVARSPRKMIAEA